MSCPTHIRHILKRDGTNQFERLMEALRPAFIRVDEKSMDDLLKFVQDFGGQVQFYTIENARDGDWKAFFEDLTRTTEPHLALMITFLEIYRNAQDHINEFTLRHLEYYYKKILQISQKPALADQVYLLLELAKNTSSLKLAKGSQFKAGKDQSGKELVYESTAEIVLNNAKVDSLKTVFTGKGPDYRIYSAAAADSADGAGKKPDDPSEGWYTFGRSQVGISAGKKNMTDAVIGFAFASPVLALKEGKRTITLTLTFRNPSVDSILNLSEILAKDYSHTFEVYLSGKKEWLGPLHPVVNKTVNGKSLEIITTLDAVDSEVVNYDSSLLGDSLDTEYPVLKILIDSTAEPCPHEWLRYLRLYTADLTVSVEGLRGLVLQNDLVTIDPSKPFQPFGPAPSPGSTLYIGSSETFNKKLDTLQLCFKWKDLPTGFGGFSAYYNLYDGNHDTDGFKASVSALIDKQWIPGTDPEQFSLFDTKTAKKKKRNVASEKWVIGSAKIETGIIGLVAYDFLLSGLQTGEIRRSLNVGKINFKSRTVIEEPTRYDNTVTNGFIRLELADQDFGHKQYPGLYTRQAMEIGSYMSANPKTGSAPALPNQPYTPVIEYISLNYSASEVINMESTGSQTGRMFYIEPFGEAQTSPGGNGSGVCLLPSFSDEGYLFIGLSGLVPRQNLSLLFQIAESSAASADNISADDLKWWYLRKDQWIRLKKQEIISDSTKGLSNSGIIVLDIPGDANDDNHVMPGSLHWLRISVPGNSEGANRLIGINAQAVTAEFKDQGNDPSHLCSVLAAGSVSKLVVPESGIKKIIQPYASFGGKPAEGDQPFYEPYYTRVSERLRHKNRGITIWDLERLVLEQFPGTYKVKCLNHSSLDTDIAPGNITMVVIENIRNRNAVNPLQPRTSKTTLVQIGEFIEKYVSPFALIAVQNPFYEEILVDFKVSFLAGYDAGYYRQVLNEEIKKFLSPWAYEEGCDIMFDNVIFKSSILNFIEEREYVDYLTDFKMYQITPNWGIGCMEVQEDFVVGDQEKSIDLDQAEGSTSRSILVSAVQHDIYVLSAGEYVCGLS